MSDDGIVYSTGVGQICPDCARAKADCVCAQERPAAGGDGVVRVRREVKGRRGKTVTRISGLPLSGAALKELARRLKQRCGSGGGRDGADLLIQGDQVAAVIAALAAEGFEAKRAGG